MMDLAKDSLEVLLTTPEGVLFEGRAHHLMVPGEQGVFEVLPYHKPLMSRIFRGEVTVDDRSFPVQRGIIQVLLNHVVAILEPRRE